MAADAEFIDGFDKYGVSGNPLALMVEGEWTSYSVTVPAATVVAALSGTGYAIRFVQTGNTSTISKTLAANYARFIGGATVSCSLNVTAAPIVFNDITTAQLCVTIETSGKLGIRAGSVTGTLLATSSVNISANTVHVIEWDVTIHNTLGAYKVWLDGVATSLNATGVNTRSTANNYANAIMISSGVTAFSHTFIIDHMYNYFFLAAGSSDTPLLTNPIIETQFPNSDGTVTFTPSGGGGNFAQVDHNPPGASYVASATVGQEDLYGFPALVSAPNHIYTAAVKIQALRSGAGARTVEVHTNSGSTDSAGTLAAVAPGATAGYFASYFDNDPDTAVPWTVAGLNAATAGPKVAS